jgi:hypothetical protein
MNTGSSKKRFALYGCVGILIIGLAEGLLFGGNQLVEHWFTPIVWPGYVSNPDFNLRSQISNRLMFDTQSTSN